MLYNCKFSLKLLYNANYFQNELRPQRSEDSVPRICLHYTLTQTYTIVLSLQKQLLLHSVL